MGKLFHRQVQKASKHPSTDRITGYSQEMYKTYTRETGYIHIVYRKGLDTTEN